MIGAYLIGKWMNRPYSHVFMGFDSSSLGLRSVYHAAHGMVHFMARDNFEIINHVVREYKINITEQQHTNMLRRAILLAGLPYAKLELAETVLYDIAHTLGIKYTPSDEVGYICSELVGAFLTAELGYVFTKPGCILNPADIDNALAKNNILV